MRTTQENPVAPHYLRGFADAKLKEAESLDTVCCSLIPNYSVERYEAIALRGYLGKETQITVYAIDKTKKAKLTGETLPVKKFKVLIPVEDLLELFSNINFTISNGNYNLDEIEVMNK